MGYGLVFTLILGLALRLWLMFDSLWYDEAFTLRLAQLSLPELLAATAYDVHPPAWYILEWLTIRLLGSSAWALRLPALLLGLAAIWLAYQIFKALELPASVQRLSVALVGLSPFLIYYSAEARMYAGLLCLVLLATWSAISRDWLLFGLAAGLGLITHNLMVLYLLPLVVVYLLTSGGWGLVKASPVIALPFVLWLPLAINQARAVTGSYWILPISPGRIVYVVDQVLVGSWLPTGLILPVGMIALMLLALGSAAAWRARAWPVMAVALGPLALAVSISLLIGPVLIDRVLIGSAPFLLSLVAWGGYAAYQQAGRWSWPAGLIALAAILVSFLTSQIRPDYTASYNSLAVLDGEHCYHLTPGSNVLAQVYLPRCDHYTWSAPRKPNGLSPETIGIIGLDERDIERVPRGITWLFHTAEPFSNQAEFDELNRILNKYPASDEIILFQNEFVASRAWRLDR
jgi:uncharacterized membrane protein